MLHIYNSLTKKKEKFIPIEPGKVRIYVCGMTVYDKAHIGHARVMIVFDIVARYLRASGFEVNYVRNITDIDDKIIQRANENSESIQNLTARYIQALYKDSNELHIIPPNKEPKATEFIAEIITLIGQLLAKNYAYQGKNGDIYFDVHQFKSYGLLSGKQLEDLRAGERVEISADKKNPLDFVLWKMTKPNEPAWDSPWGLGRPGWHIECSAMSLHELGSPFDIHGGGQDLQFPHHENEIAQSEAATGHKFVNYWMHNGFVRINDEKMSKSLGNFFTIEEVLSYYHPEVLRYFILSSHYRSPLNYAESQLSMAKQALTGIYSTLRGVPTKKIENKPLSSLDHPLITRFRAAMDDDFNTPEALAVLNEAKRELNNAKYKDNVQQDELAKLLYLMGSTLGLLNSDPEEFLQSPIQAHGNQYVFVEPVLAKIEKMPAHAVQLLTNQEIEQLIQQRVEERKNKNWQEADRIRDILKEQNITIEDTATKTLWRRG
ncbi:cysteine--tRNA ligase [Candidatus Nitrosacidococcus tergens]|uniref:Cysteine--tRNA ligase n=1 Tax=Candidatus Nitrosacidococcus tergens TaxID=553981 RepID=A0A7G1Q8Q9_9GAMM|nr:cysteine--tRNA ligase [Candidatus Nitrosacidococcus tergens]CAB1275183.1 cysteinyl-tRNA synthetase [Candidatus Nitrosacidococcus tergens]